MGCVSPVKKRGYYKEQILKKSIGKKRRKVEERKEKVPFYIRKRPKSLQGDERRVRNLRKKQ